MKTHFLTLFSIENRKKTLFYFLSSIILIIASLIVGIGDNLLGISMLSLGLIWLYYSFVHIWKISRNFVRLIFISLGLMLLEFLAINILSWLQKTQYLSEGLFLGIFFLICTPLLIVGIYGTYSRRTKHTPPLLWAISGRRGSLFCVCDAFPFWQSVKLRLSYKLPATMRLYRVVKKLNKPHDAIVRERRDA